MRTKEKKQMQAISAGSMADVAFLLLVFFLITTTLANDKGLKMMLPPKNDNRESIVKNDRNVLKILINSRNELLIEEEPFKLEDITKKVKEFVINPEKLDKFADSPQKAIVSIKSARSTNYMTYIQVLDKIKRAYHELRAKEMGISIEAYLKFDKRMASKNLVKEFEESKKKFPIQISEAEPTKLED